MAREKLCGIYAIENLVNSKIYVGQSIDIYLRWKAHKEKLNKNMHDNIHLQSSWNKYGKNNFQFNILEYCDEEKLNELEIYYINKYNSNKNGYNMNLGGNGNRGYRHTDETKQLQSVLAKGKYAGEKNYFYGKRYKYGEHPCFGKECTDITRKRISDSRKGKYTGENGSFYGKSHTEDARKKMSNAKQGKYIGENNPHYGKENSPEAKAIIKKAVARPIIQFDKNMNFIKKWDSIRDAEIDGHKNSNIGLCCKGKQNFHHGYIWKYASDVENVND